MRTRRTKACDGWARQAYDGRAKRYRSHYAAADKQASDARGWTQAQVSVRPQARRCTAAASKKRLNNTGCAVAPQANPIPALLRPSPARSPQRRVWPRRIVKQAPAGRKTSTRLLHATNEVPHRLFPPKFLVMKRQRIKLPRGRGRKRDHPGGRATPAVTVRVSATRSAAA